MQQLPVLELFPTLQGEGEWAGYPAIFLRLAGCDVGCHWCDTRYSWDIPHHSYRPVPQIVNEILKMPPAIVVITGGEPSMHDLRALTKGLAHRKRIHIETSGVYPLRGQFDWITLSPKKFKPALPTVVEQADELKIVVYNQHDLEWARSWEHRISSSVKRCLQPEWGRRQKMMPHILRFLHQYPQWHLSVQLHKILGIP